MKFDFTVGDTEKTNVEFSRGWFWGKITIKANGKTVYSNNVFSPATHFSLTLCRQYEFTVGDREVKTIRIEKTRPLLIAGVRSQKYRVFCDGVLLAEYEGL